MKTKLQVESCKLKVRRTNLRPLILSTCNLQPATCNLRYAFTLIEVIVVSGMLVLIVLALMTVFNGTQTAFRSGITQVGVQESGRAVMDLIKTDLEAMTPSFGISNNLLGAQSVMNGGVNFHVQVTTFGYNPPPTPLIQVLPASGQLRTNAIEYIFILSKANVNGSPNWIGTGYLVLPHSPDGSLYSLYRFSTNCPVMTTSPWLLLIAWENACSSVNASIVSPTNYPPFCAHLMDGVVELRMRAYDPNGLRMTNTYPSSSGPITTTNNNVQFYLPFLYGETSFEMRSNTLPASVEVELGVLEDRALQRAESLPDVAQSNYLAHCAGQVHVFRQRVWIRNMDPTAYQ